MEWDKIKGFVLGGGLLFIWGVTLGFLEWRAAVHADDAIVNAGFASPANVAANAESIKDLERDAEKLDVKIEKIVDILLED